MKYLILCGFFLIFRVGIAQDLELVDDRYIHQSVLNHKLGASNCYVKIRQWFVDTYVSSTDVLEISDSDMLLLMGKGSGNIDVTSRLGLNSTKPIDYTIKIEIKDDRFRLTFSNILIVDEPYSGNGYQRIQTPVERLIVDEMLIKRNGKPSQFHESIKSGSEQHFDQIGIRIVSYLENGDDSW